MLEPTARLTAAIGGSLKGLATGLTALLMSSEAGADPQIERLRKGRLVPLAAVSQSVLPIELREAMEQEGLAVVDGQRIRFPFQLSQVGPDVIVGDYPVAGWRRDAQAVDPLWAGPALARMMVRGRARCALDVGCGSGVLALAAARFCDRVIGVDLNPRALALARFNVALNDLPHVEIRQSDLFEAVRGQQFDRIIFNSPTGFELRPRNWLEAGEPILERFFRDLLEHLTPDGYAQVSLCFQERRGDVFWKRLRTWLDADRHGLRLVFFEQFRLDTGAAFFASRLVNSIRDRSNGLAIQAVSRGWLVISRGEPFAVRVPLNYKRLSSELPVDFGDSFVRLLNQRSGRVEPRDLEPIAAPLPPAIAATLRVERIEWS